MLCVKKLGASFIEMETAATPDDKKATKERPQDDFSISLVERLKFVRKEAHRHKGTVTPWLSEPHGYD